jgi:hypothetical protein
MRLRKVFCTTKTQAFKIFLLLLKIKEQVFGKHSLPGGVIDSLSN